MTWAIPHTHSRDGATERFEYDVVHSTIRWPRGLMLVGLCGLLLSAWGGIVPYVGPIFGYGASGVPSWHWSAVNAWLYLAPGAVGVAASLALIARARAGRSLARAELALLGLLLVAGGAWYVLGPAAWPVVHPGGVVFGSGGSLGVFTRMVGYNLGVGILLATLGGMAAKAGVGERDVAVVEAARSDRPVTSAGTVGSDDRAPGTSAPATADPR